jgi:amidohydrolase
MFVGDGGNAPSANNRHWTRLSSGPKEINLTIQNSAIRVGAMPLLNNAIQMHPEITSWRQQLHMRPELLFEVQETAAFVEAKLRVFGCDEIITGLGRTGVVGLIRGRRGEGPVIGLRADMDALPIVESTNLPYSSRISGCMHACGHDGHTAMLLGASRHLCETRNFRGSVAVIFQPAEEGGGGGREMVNDGLMERFKIERVFGMHNEPGLAVGKFALRSGALMASADKIAITVRGRGGHAADPHRAIDPIFIGAQIVSALQGIVARNTDPLESLVVSVTKFHAGEAFNIIPPLACLDGTVRTLSKSLRESAEIRIRETVEGVARALGGEAQLDYQRHTPVTFNHELEAKLAAEVARDVVGAQNVDSDVRPQLASEDFSFMLEARPGALILIGNGETDFCHNPNYDFNDAIIPHGVSYWVRLAETALTAES